MIICSLSCKVAKVEWIKEKCSEESGFRNDLETFTQVLDRNWMEQKPINLTKRRTNHESLFTFRQSKADIPSIWRFFLTKFNILISRTCLYTLRKLLHLYLYYTSPVFPGKPGILLSAFWLVLGSCSFFFPPIGSGRSFFSIRVRPLNVYKTAAAGFIDFPAIFSIFLTDFLPGKYMLSALFLDLQGS